MSDSEQSSEQDSEQITRKYPLDMRFADLSNANLADAFLVNTNLLQVNFGISLVCCPKTDDQTAHNYPRYRAIRWNSMRQRTISVFKVSPDYSQIVTIVYGESLTCWSVRTGQPTASFFSHKLETTSCVEFSPDGSLLACDITPKLVLLLDSRTCECFEEIPLGCPIQALYFTPDSKRLVIPNFFAGGFYIISVYDDTQSCSVPFRVNQNLPICITGKHIIAMPNVTTVAFLNIRTGRIEKDVPLIWPANTLALAPNATLLASASAKTNQIRVVDLSSGNLQSNLHGHQGQFLSLQFAPSSRLLASVNSEGEIFVWRVSCRELIQRVVPKLGQFRWFYLLPDDSGFAYSNSKLVAVEKFPRSQAN